MLHFYTPWKHKKTSPVNINLLKVNNKNTKNKMSLTLNICRIFF